MSNNSDSEEYWSADEESIKIGIQEKKLLPFEPEEYTNQIELEDQLTDGLKSVTEFSQHSEKLNQNDPCITSKSGHTDSVIDLAELNLNSTTAKSMDSADTNVNIQKNETSINSQINETEINDTKVETEATPPKQPEPELEPEEIERRRLVALEHKSAGNNYIGLKDYNQAMNSYTDGLNICPTQCSHEKSILLSNRALCYVYLQQDDNAIADCTNALTLEPNYLKARNRRAQAFDRLQRYEEALTDYQEIVKCEPNNQEAKKRIAILPDQIKEQQEKIKAEAISKLKELGNMVLNPFGMSTENFKMVQDPQTGGYNISYSPN